MAALPEYADIFVDHITGQDMIHSDTLLVITDVNNPAQFAAPEIAENVATVAIIDHHRKTGDFKREPAISYIEPSASSACELVAEMLEQAMPIGGLHREEADVLYACGPTPMLRALKAYAEEKGMEAWISMEEKMACGIGACLACVCRSTEVDHHSHVHNKRICKDGPVFRAEEVEL